MKKTLILIVALLLVFSCGKSEEPAEKQDGKSAGMSAPDFELESIKGGKVKLSDYRGKKAVLLVFSTTWCPHCRTEIPEFKRIYGEKKDRIEIFNIDVNEPPDRVSAFVRQQELPYPVLLDRDGRVARKYKVVGVPTNIIVSREGTVVCNPCLPLGLYLDRILK